MVFVLYKKMTGVAKISFKYGKTEAEAEREVRDYLVREGVVKKVLDKKEEAVVEEKNVIKRKVLRDQVSANNRKRFTDSTRKNKGEIPMLIVLPS